MKIRAGYVSNSSSSSFLCREDTSRFRIACIKLTVDQIKAMKAIYDWDGKILHELDPNREYYITEYVADYEDKYYELKESSAYIGEYDNGGHGGPYDEDMYNEYQNEWGESIYIKKSDDVAEQMSFSKFCKKYKEAGHPTDVIVKYETDGVTLKWVY